MFAKVRKIKVGSVVKTKAHTDTFVSGMAAHVGKVLKFGKSFKPGWYLNHDFYWHKSWLIIRRPRKKSVKQKRG